MQPCLLVELAVPKKPADSPDALPSTSQTPLRSDASLLADELAKSAGQIGWPRMPELKEFEQMADMIISAGLYNCTGSFPKAD